MEEGPEENCATYFIPVERGTLSFPRKKGLVETKKKS